MVRQAHQPPFQLYARAWFINGLAGYPIPPKPRSLHQPNVFHGKKGRWRQGRVKL